MCIRDSTTTTVPLLLLLLLLLLPLLLLLKAATSKHYAALLDMCRRGSEVADERLAKAVQEHNVQRQAVVEMRKRQEDAREVYRRDVVCRHFVLEWVGGQMDGWMDGWMDGRMDG